MLIAVDNLSHVTLQSLHSTSGLSIWEQGTLQALATFTEPLWACLKRDFEANLHYLKPTIEAQRQ
jgi:hypothetical protein